MSFVPYRPQLLYCVVLQEVSGRLFPSMLLLVKIQCRVPCCRAAEYREGKGEEERAEFI